MRSMILAPLALLAGCTTHLESRMVAAGAGPGDAPINGWSYSLSRIDYTVEITRTLTKCPAPGSLDVGFDVEAAVTTSYGPAEEVLIDATHLTNGNKTTSVTFENYPNGLLKSVNAQVASHDADTIKSAVGLSVGIAKLAIGVPPLPSAPVASANEAPVWVATVSCTPVIGSARVKALKVAGDDRDVKAKKRDEALAALAGFDADHAGDASPADKVKAERADLSKTVRETTKAASDSATAYGKAKDVLGFKIRTGFDGDAVGNGLFEVSADSDGGTRLAELLQVELSDGRNKETWVICDNLTVRPAAAQCGKAVEGQLGKASLAQTAFTEVLKRTRVAWDFRTTASRTALAGLRPATACNIDKNPCGVLYRAAVPARLQLCKETAPAACGTLPVGNSKIIVRDEHAVPQLGGLRSLPLRNDMFESNSLVATFAADGSPTTMIYAKTSAELPGIFAAGEQIVGGVSQVDSYNRAAGLRRTQNATAISNAATALEEAKRKEAEAIAARREAEAKLKAATGGSDGTEDAAP